MPFAAVNGIDVHFELHGSGPPLSNISGSGNDLRRSPASILPINRVFDGGHTFLVQDRTAFPAIIEFLELDGGES